jgi:hypothetical protein
MLASAGRTQGYAMEPSALAIDSRLDSIEVCFFRCRGGFFPFGPCGTGVGARGPSCKWLADTPPSPPDPTGLMALSEPEIAAATRSESAADSIGGLSSDQSAFVVFALFRRGPSSASVGSSAADVLPSAVGFFFGGRPRGLPVGALDLDALDDGLDGFMAGIGTGSKTPGVPALARTGVIGASLPISCGWCCWNCWC